MSAPRPGSALVPSAGTAGGVGTRAPRRPAPAARTELRRVLPAALAAWLAQQGFPGAHARDVNGDTPLMRAAWRGEDAVVLALLAQGAAPETVNDDGNNALWFACLHGSPTTILHLLDAGAPIDHANDDDITCLMQAAASGRLDVLRLLLALGATAGVCAPDGRRALDMATDLCQQLRRQY